MQTYLSRIEAAQYLTDRGLPVSKNTLGKWATTGGGPVFQRFGLRAVYTASNLDSWANAKLTAPRCSTSEAATA